MSVFQSERHVITIHMAVNFSLVVGVDAPPLKQTDDYLSSRFQG